MKKVDCNLQNSKSDMGKDKPYSIMMCGENMITKTHLGKPEASLGVNLPGIRELPAVITYNEFGSNTDATIYVADDKEKLILVPVDHTSTISKKPSLYLKKGTANRKTGYVSGLFPPRGTAVYSGDINHPVAGMKQMFPITCKDGGEAVFLEGLR